VIFYEHEKGLYLNITNRCPTACVFCVKNDWAWSFRGQDLKLKGEPAVEEILEGLEERLAVPGRWREVVFCGFGEPTMRIDAMNLIGARARRLRPGLPLRLNTVGLGSLINGRDIAPELASYLDSVSVSLNTADPAQWLELMLPAPAYRERGFAAARSFVERCVAARLRTRVTAVERPDADLGALAAYASSVGAAFVARPALVEPGAREKSA
jgi:TatD family-associated radical SAM protein